MRALIKQGLMDMGLERRVPSNAAEHLSRYGQLLLEKNQVMNLTAITEPDQVAKLHMLDCAALLQYCDFQNKRLLDVGTGAGFPGMVLKILTPSLDVTLLDSLNKRLEWLEEISSAARAVSILGGRLLSACDYTIPGTNVTHRLVRIEKVAPTPTKYPRRFAQIKKNPL